MENTGGMRGRVTDIHMHVVPAVDDGSRSIEESCEMLRLAAEEGIGTVFATPHSSAFTDCDVRAAFGRLKAAVRAQEIPVELYLGCELRISASAAAQCVRGLNEGVFPTMGDSRCVLSEFTFGTELRDYLYCIDLLIRNGYTPIMAHLERYANVDLRFAEALRGAGALIQINAYSIADERDEQIRRRANALLAERFVDFIGTDAHRMDHRPPRFHSGMCELSRSYTGVYAAQVAVDNPRRYLLGQN